MKDKDFEEDVDGEMQSPYCSICGACGEDPCCPATMCQMHPHGDYCERYLAELRIGYCMDRYGDKADYDELWDTFYGLRFIKQTGNPLKTHHDNIGTDKQTI